MNNVYNPDILNCLANLSNDEVFTPPSVVNNMLDMLPQEIFKDKNITFLDPACKSGVFLREIAKRLLDGLKDEIPDLQERIDHIYKKQLFGISITTLTGLVSRRSLYCSKFPNKKYSVCQFDNEQGNIKFNIMQHTWKKDKCIFCGAAKQEYDRDKSLETYAYEFIHTENPEEIFNMKFDVIIGNPPYQIEDGGNGKSAKPVYHLFIQQAKKLNPKYLIMIIPSRWFTDGKGLDKFREEMLKDKKIKKIVDFLNSKDCFPSNSIGGGVNYFLWKRNYNGLCDFSTVIGHKSTTIKRDLNEFPFFIRQNNAVNIIHKVINHKLFNPLSNIVSSRNPFGIPTSARGQNIKTNCLKLIHSKGEGFVSSDDVTKNFEYIDKYKVMVSRIIFEHACEPDKNGMYRILSKILVLKPKEVCTDSYLIIGAFDSYDEAYNLSQYLKSKFARFLILQTLASINLSRDKFNFIPLIPFDKQFSEEDIYKTFNISQNDIEYINSLIYDFE